MSLSHDLSTRTFDLSITPKGKRGICRAKTPKPTFREIVKEFKNHAIVDRDHSLLAYKALSDAEQGKLKDVGSYVPGYFKDGLRRNDAMVRRSAVTLDLDELTPEQLEWIIDGHSEIWRWAFILHNSRKHSRQFPRVRIVVFFKEAIPADLYEPVARYLATLVLKTKEESLDAVDEVSYRPSQVAYWQSTCSDQKPIFIVNDDETGAEELLDVDAFIDEMDIDVEDHASWPHSAKRVNRLFARSKKSEHPLEKPGIVGAWNKLVHKKGGIEWVIKTLMPNTYIDPDPHSSKPRYTYAKGQGKHGAIIEDDGLFLYSNHSTDPAYGQNCNAWDLVRLHNFGHLDVDDDDQPLVVEPHKSATLPSHAAMDVWVRDAYPEIGSIMFADKFDNEAVEDDDEEGKDDRRRKANQKQAIIDLIGDLDEDDLDEDLFNSKNWHTKLDCTRDGDPKCTFQNMVLISAHDDRMNKAFQWDLMAEETRVMRGFRSKRGMYPTTTVLDPSDGEPLRDVHGSIMKCILTAPLGKGSAGYGFTSPAEGDIWRAIDTAAQMRPFHPLQRRVEKSEWDGDERMDTFFIRHLKIADTPYHRELSRMFFMAGISRIYTPGAKWDHVYIFEGAQGGGKSTFLRYLAMDDKFFGELNVDLADQQKVMEHTKGKFVLEIAELGAMKKSEIEAIKSFITALSDESRMAYDRKVTRIKRSYLLTATTNEKVYLKDPTGNRRFIPIFTPTSLEDPIDLDAMRDEVQQAWAEALVAFRAWQGELGLKPHQCPPLILSKKAMRQAAQDASSRSVADPVDLIAEELELWLDAHVPRSSLLGEHEFLPEGESDDIVQRCVVTVASVLRDCYGQRPGAVGGLNVRANDIQEALRRLGWENTSSWPTRLQVETRSADGKRIRNNAWVRKGSIPGDYRHGFRVIRSVSNDAPRNRHRSTRPSDLI